MGINNMVENMQEKLKSSSLHFVTLGTKILTGLLLGLTLALIGSEIIGYGSFAFTLVILVITGVFMKISKNWSLLNVVLFDLFCVLMGLVLRMYIMIAPGA